MKVWLARLSRQSPAIKAEYPTDSCVQRSPTTHCISHTFCVQCVVCSMVSTRWLMALLTCTVYQPVHLHSYSLYKHVQQTAYVLPVTCTALSELMCMTLIITTSTLYAVHMRCEQEVNNVKDNIMAMKRKLEELRGQPY